MSYAVDRSNDWKHVDGVVDAVYTRPDGTSYQNVKVRLGATVMGDFVTGVGGKVKLTKMSVWVKASDDADPVNTLEPQGVFAISGVEYQIVTVDGIRPDGSQWLVSCKVHQ